MIFAKLSKIVILEKMHIKFLLFGTSILEGFEKGPGSGLQSSSGVSGGTGPRTLFSIIETREHILWFCL